MWTLKSTGLQDSVTWSSLPTLTKLCCSLKMLEPQRPLMLLVVGTYLGLRFSDLRGSAEPVSDFMPLSGSQK